MSLFAACLMCVLCMGTVDVDTCSSVNLCIVCIINVTPFLLSACASTRVHLVHSRYVSPSDYTVSASLRVQEGTTPLLRAAQEGHGGVARFLLARGSSIQEQDNVG